MAWYDRLIGRKPQNSDEEKLNFGGRNSYSDIEHSREPAYSYELAYEDLEIVNRGVNMIVDDVSEIPTLVSRENSFRGLIPGIKRAKVETLLNKSPNPYQDINSFKRNLITDYLIDGNIFIYFDGAHMYHLSATDVHIHASRETYIDRFTLNDTTFSPDEITVSYTHLTLPTTPYV